MTIELNEENARNLLLAANLLEVEPERLVNDWLLKQPLDALNDAETGDLRALFDILPFETERDAKRVAVRLMSWERREMGKDWGLPEIKLG